MSFEIPLFKYPLQAAADLSTHQFKAVVIDGNGRVNLAGTQGLPIAGILQNKPNALGVACEIMQLGISKMVASAAIAAGARVATTNVGTAVTAATGNVVIGQAIEAAGAAGNIIAVLLTGCGHTAP